MGDAEVSVGPFDVEGVFVRLTAGDVDKRG